MNVLGKELFETVYAFLKHHRMKETEERVMHEELKKMVSGNKQKLSAIFQLDGLVFMEILNK